jgi:hypothetical protein
MTKHRRVFVAVLEVETDEPEYDKEDMAYWIDLAMSDDDTFCRLTDVTVYDTLADLAADLKDPIKVKADPCFANLGVHHDHQDGT